MIETAHRAALRPLQEVRSVPSMSIPDLLGNERFHRQTLEFLRQVSEEIDTGGIGEHNSSVGGDDQKRVGRAVDEKSRQHGGPGAGRGRGGISHVFKASRPAIYRRKYRTARRPNEILAMIGRCR